MSLRSCCFHCSLVFRISKVHHALYKIIKPCIIVFLIHTWLFFYITVLSLLKLYYSQTILFFYEFLYPSIFFFLQHIRTFSNMLYLFWDFLCLGLVFHALTAILWPHEPSCEGPGHFWLLLKLSLTRGSGSRICFPLFCVPTYPSREGIGHTLT